MTKLLTAIASYLDVLLLKLFVVFRVLMVFLRLVLGVLATWRLYVVFATAPPDLTAKLGPVRATAPIEVLCLDIVFPTILAHLLLVIVLTTTHLKFLDSVFHLLTVNDQIFLLFFQLNFGLKVFVCLVSFKFHLAVHVMFLFLVELDGGCVLVLKNKLFLNKLLCLLHVIVSFHGGLSNILLKLQ